MMNIYPSSIVGYVGKPKKNREIIEKKRKQFFKELFMILPEKYKTPQLIKKLDQFKLYGKLEQDNNQKKEEEQIRPTSSGDFWCLDVREKEDFEIFLDAIRFNRKTWRSDLYDIEDKIENDKKVDSKFVDFYNTNNNFWLELIKKNGTILKILPKQMITHNMCVDAVRTSWEAIKFVPDTMKNEEVCNVTINSYLNSDDEKNVLDFIPKKFITNDMAFNVLKKVNPFKIKGKLEDYISLDFLDDNKIKELLKCNPYIFEIFPDSYKLKEDICLYALKCGLSGDSLPLKIRYNDSIDSLNFNLEAVKYDSRFLRNIPEKYRTKELYDLLLEKDPEIIRRVPNEYKTKELYDSLLEKDPYIIRLVPNEFLTQEKCINAIKRASSGTLYYYDLGIPSNFKNYSFYLNYFKKLGERTFYKGHPANYYYIDDGCCYFEDEIDEFLKLSKNELCAMSFFSSLGTFDLDIDKVTFNEFKQAQHQNLDEYYIKDIQSEIDNMSKNYDNYKRNRATLLNFLRITVNLYFKMHKYKNEETIIKDILYKFDEKTANVIISLFKNKRTPNLNNQEDFIKSNLDELCEYVLIDKKNGLSGRKK